MVDGQVMAGRGRRVDAWRWTMGLGFGSALMVRERGHPPFWGGLFSKGLLQRNSCSGGCFWDGGTFGSFGSWEEERSRVKRLPTKVMVWDAVLGAQCPDGYG